MHVVSPPKYCIPILLLSKYSMYLHIETNLICLCPKRKDFHEFDMITNTSYGVSSSVDEIVGSKRTISMQWL